MGDFTLSKKYSKGILTNVRLPVCLCLTIFFILLFACFSFSQISNYINTLTPDDEAIWNNPNATEEERLNDLVHQSLLYIEKGEWDNARRYSDKIIEFELGRREKKYRSYYLLQEALKMPDRDSNKINKIQESIDLATSVGYDITIQAGYTFMGITYAVIGDEEKALELWEKVIELTHDAEKTADNTDDYHLALYNGWAEIQVAMMMFRHGKEEEAEKYAAEAIRTYYAIPDEQQIYYGYYELGMVHRQLKQYDKALEYFHKALPLMPDDNPYVHTEMAYAYEAQGDWAKALEYYEYSREKSRVINKPGEEYHALCDMGIMLVELGELDRADKVAEELLLDANKEKPNIPRYRVHSLLGSIAAEREKHNIAIGHYQTSLKWMKEENIRNDYWESRNHLFLGESYLAKNNFNKAIEHCLASIPRFEEHQDLIDQETAYETLYNAYKKSGNYGKANEILEKILKLKEDQHPIETAKQLQEFEFSKKTLADSLKQVEEMLKVKLAHQTELRVNNRSKYIAIGVGALIFLLSIGLWSRLRYVRKTQAELEEKNRIIEAEKEKAKSSEKAKQQFLANMSHEIRTPMNAIKGMTDILIRRKPKKQQLSYLNAIKESSNSLLVIVNDILDISKIEAGKIDLEEIPFSIKDVIQNVNTIMQLKADEKGLLLKTNIADNITDKVIGDPTRLHQVLLNLTGNAIKFTEKGMVAIQLKAEDMGDGKMMAKFRVSDTGVGIGEDRLEKIFETFEQAYSDTTRKFGGTGLGLSISKKLVELQNGKIWAESDKGKGSQFYFEIPFAVNMGEELYAESNAPILNEYTLSQLKGLKLLLVEDNAFNAIVAQEELEDAIENINVDVAENGVIAIEKVTHGDYDIVLMDVQMPVMNGYEATHAIRNLSNGKSEVPIIAMTANVMKEEVERCYEAGMNDFIGKPFDTENLVGIIVRLLKVEAEAN